jgi:hypothetical protein
MTTRSGRSTTSTRGSSATAASEEAVADMGVFAQTKKPVAASTTTANRTRATAFRRRRVRLRGEARRRGGDEDVATS